ncbi:MAG: hypothetical protein J7L83_04215, partial [Thaumarchaeota archaeon]|nr:hypothetical protein [Nitrososphaerota archaeon]
MRQSDIALTATEIAEKCDANPKRVSTILNKMYRKGEVVRRGYITKNGREVMFRGGISGYLYGLPGTNQIEKRLASGEHLPSWTRALYHEIRKYSEMKRWVQVNALAENLGRRPYEIIRMAEKLQSTARSIRIYKSTKSKWLYDDSFFTEDEIRQWMKEAERIDSETGKISQRIGVLHEKYCQAVLEKLWEKVVCAAKFKQVIRNGKTSYNIRLSNGREIDRILRLRIHIGSEELLGFDAIFEFKYKKGGVEARDIKDFLEKLAKSFEYGYEEGGRRYMKLCIIPVVVAPSFRKDAIEYAKKHGVILLPTWKLAQLLKREFEIDFSFRKIANELLRV